MKDVVTTALRQGEQLLGKHLDGYVKQKRPDLPNTGISWCRGTAIFSLMH